MIYLAVAAAVVVVAALLAAAVAARRRRGPPIPSGDVARFCERCGRPLDLETGACSFCGRPTQVASGRLEVVSGPGAGANLALDGEVASVGSLAEVSSLAVPDPEVARKHFAIRRAYGGYELCDLGSPGGVYVNGEKVARRLLSPGDVIRIGSSEIVFRAVEEAA